MRLIEIDLSGFGRLVNSRLEFGPGLNLVFGPNEAGKSTLQKAIAAFLYGFYDDGSITASKREEAAAAKPWDAATVYGGSLAYELDNGKRFRVIRTFDPRPTTALVTLPDEKDVTREYKSASHGRLFFADQHLGMPKDVFESVCCVRQAELMALEQSATAITDTLVRLSTSGSADTTTAEALAILDQALKDNVGTARSWTKPLAKATETVNQLEDRRSRAIQARSALLAKVAEANQAETNLHRMEQERQRLEYLQLLSERDDATSRLAALSRLGAEADQYAAEVAKWTSYAEFPVKLQPEVAALSARRSALVQECQDKEPTVVKARQQLESLSRQVATLDATIVALSDAQNVAVKDQWLIQQKATEWQAAAAAEARGREQWEQARDEQRSLETRLLAETDSLKGLTRLSEDDLDNERQTLAGAQNAVALAQQGLSAAEAEWQRVGMSEAQFSVMETAVLEMQSGARKAPAGSRGCLSVFSRQREAPASATPTDLVVYSQIKPIHTNLLRRRSEAEQARSELVQCEAGTRGRLNGLVGENILKDLDTLKLRVREYHALAESVRRASETAAALEADLADAHGRTGGWYSDLRASLGAHGFAEDDVLESIAAYSRQCERKTQFDAAQAERDWLLQMGRVVEGDIRAQDERRGALRDTEAKLQDLLLTAGIDSSQSGLDGAIEGFATGVANQGHWSSAQTRHQIATRNLELAGGAAQKQRIETSIADLNARILAMEGTSSHLAGLRPNKQPQEYASLIRQTDHEWGQLREDYIRLEESVGRESATLEHPADVDEELAAARAELANLERYRDALDSARRELTSAIEDYQRQFAPRLEARMGQSLSQITNGRYSRVSVDPVSLHVSLVSGEVPSPVGVERLSTGTRDLVYLMLRIGLAQMMSTGGERLPLMLDDPFVQCDRGRLERALSHVIELAHENQVFLFTKDEWTRDRLAIAGNDGGRNSMHVLG